MQIEKKLARAQANIQIQGLGRQVGLRVEASADLSSQAAELSEAKARWYMLYTVQGP